MVGGGGRRRKKWLHGDEAVEGGALFRRERVRELARVEDGLSLLGWELAVLPEGMLNGEALLRGEAGKLLHAAADLLTLFGSEALDRFCAIEQALALRWRHLVELGEPIVHALLHIGRQLAEARLVIEGALLVSRRKLAVLRHPLGEVLLAGSSANGSARLTGAGRSRVGWTGRVGVVGGGGSVSPAALVCEQGGGSEQAREDADREGEGGSVTGWGRGRHPSRAEDRFRVRGQEKSTRLLPGGMV